MKFSMIDNVTGRKLLANKAQRDFLLRTGRARVAAQGQSEEGQSLESPKPAKKAVKAAKAPNARRGYNRRDMAATTKDK